MGKVWAAFSRMWNLQYTEANGKIFKFLFFN